MKVTRCGKKLLFNHLKVFAHIISSHAATFYVSWMKLETFLAYSTWGYAK